MFGGVHKKDSKITFSLENKANSSIRAEHRRRLKRATDFASLRVEVNLLVKDSLIKVLANKIAKRKRPI